MSAAPFDSESSHGMGDQLNLLEGEHPGTTRKVKGSWSGADEGAVDLVPTQCSQWLLVDTQGRAVHTVRDFVLDSSQTAF